MQHLVCAIFIFQTRSRACLKNHFRNLQAPLCGIFYPHSVAVARYAALIRIKSPTNWDSQLTKSLFQTRSRVDFCASLIIPSKINSPSGFRTVRIRRGIVLRHSMIFISDAPEQV